MHRLVIFIIIFFFILSCSNKRNSIDTTKEYHPNNKAYSFKVPDSYSLRDKNDFEQQEVDDLKDKIGYNFMTKSDFIFIKSNPCNDSRIKIMISYDKSKNNEYPSYNEKLSESDLTMLDESFRHETIKSFDFISSQSGVKNELSSWHKIEYPKNDNNISYIKLNFSIKTQESEATIHTYIFHNINEQVYIKSICQKPCEENFIKDIQTVVNSFEFHNLK